MFDKQLYYNDSLPIDSGYICLCTGRNSQTNETGKTKGQHRKKKFFYWIRTFLQYDRASLSAYKKIFYFIQLFWIWLKWNHLPFLSDGSGCHECFQWHGSNLLVTAPWRVNREFLRCFWKFNWRRNTFFNK